MRIQASLDQGLIDEFVFHDHELAFRHYTVRTWGEDYEGRECRA